MSQTNRASKLAAKLAIASRDAQSEHMQDAQACRVAARCWLIAATTAMLCSPSLLVIAVWTGPVTAAAGLVTLFASLAMAAIGEIARQVGDKHEDRAACWRRLAENQERIACRKTGTPLDRRAPAVVSTAAEAPMTDTAIADFVRRQADAIVAALSDGLQAGDVLALVRTVAEAVDLADDLDTVEKQREAARQLFGLVLEETDTPWLPDAWTDPAMIAGFELLLPRLIPEPK